MKAKHHLAWYNSKGVSSSKSIYMFNFKLNFQRCIFSLLIFSHSLTFPKTKPLNHLHHTLSQSPPGITWFWSSWTRLSKRLGASLGASLSSQKFEWKRRCFPTESLQQWMESLYLIIGTKAAHFSEFKRTSSTISGMAQRTGTRQLTNIEVSQRNSNHSTLKHHIKAALA